MNTASARKYRGYEYAARAIQGLKSLPAAPDPEKLLRLKLCNTATTSLASRSLLKARYKRYFLIIIIYLSLSLSLSSAFLQLKALILIIKYFPLLSLARYWRFVTRSPRFVHVCAILIILITFNLKTLAQRARPCRSRSRTLSPAIPRSRTRPLPHGRTTMTRPARWRGWGWPEKSRRKKAALRRLIGFVNGYGLSPITFDEMECPQRVQSKMMSHRPVETCIAGIEPVCAPCVD